MSIYIDGHVHIYPGFDITELLDQAINNLYRTVKKTGDIATSCDFVLIITESYGHNVFKLLDSKTEEKRPQYGPWTLSKADDSSCLIAKKDTGETLFLIAGRQLESSDRIELISLFQPIEIEARKLPIQELAQTIASQGGIVLIPWGVGKWTGNRAQILTKFLSIKQTFFYLLGDNGNRPFFWPLPGLVNTASAKGISLLSGSDPLPLSGHHKRAGSYGSILVGQNLDQNQPGKSLKKLLHTKHQDLKPFGKPAGLIQFFFDQLSINIGNRIKKKKK